MSSIALIVMQEKKERVQSVTGVVTEALPNTLFKVKIDGEEQEILTYLAGKMRLHRIRVLIGDKVAVELEPYGGKGRIVKRL
jgi:translation initiation factor IF-1